MSSVLQRLDTSGVWYYLLGELQPLLKNAISYEEGKVNDLLQRYKSFSKNQKKKDESDADNILKQINH